MATVGLVSSASGDVSVGEVDLGSPSFYLESPNAPAHEIEPQPDQAAEPAPGTDQTVTPSGSTADETEKETPAAGEDTGEPGATAVPAEVDPFGEFDEFDTPEQPEVFDPLSGYNRVMTRINDKLYYWVLKPVAKGYGIVVPRFVRRGIDNFFENLGFPVRFVNNVLQLKVHGAGVETARFLANSTIGIAGLWDPAMQLMEIPPRDEDFGQTLGRYGIGGGFHIVLPVFGPSNVRDTVGRVADGFLNPAAYLQDSDAALAVSAGRTVNATSLRIGEYEALTADAIDLYVLLRDGYEQYRNRKIKE
ncbi:MAG: MlaA family lipoprotein [Thermodesulfobacteriota bacterium]